MSNIDIKELKDLILVPTHALYIGKAIEDIFKEECWLKSFPGEGLKYAEHADAGVMEASKNSDSLLIFSGGQTVKNWPISESLGYWMMENQRKWLGRDKIRERVITEEFARDSLETLDFSVKRFKQIVGNMPRQIVITGWGFKEKRYFMHAKALGINPNIINHIGVNEPEGFPNEIDSTRQATSYGMALRGEGRTIQLFNEYPLGNQGELLEKRLKRDPFFRGNPYNHI